MILFPNAKINLGLKVIEKRSDGYHNLESVFYPIGLCDALDVAPSPQFKFEISGMIPEGAPDENLVVKAYKLLKNDYGISPVRIHLHKKIPTGAGLGGGSSDGAFMLKLLNSLFSINLNDLELEKYALKLGADCPFFIKSKPALATGIGDKLNTFALDLSAYKIMVVKPPISVSTHEAYKNISPKLPVGSLNEFLCEPVHTWKDTVSNDFEKTVFAIYPELRKLKENFYNAGAIYASMTGSGSAIFGLFPHLPADPGQLSPKGSFIYR